MKVLGLTGGIGMGKSTAADTFRRLRVPVFDADAAVHRLQGPGGAAVRPIEAAFPGTTRDGPRGRAVDREALRARVLGDTAALQRLERIVHPLVRGAERAFLAAARRRGEGLVVLDIPLLLETGGEARLAAILARQMPDAQKRRKADRVVPTGLSRHAAQRHIRAIVGEMRG
jgi:dephospho-CoA kinase